MASSPSPFRCSSRRPRRIPVVSTRWRHGWSTTTGSCAPAPDRSLALRRSRAAAWPRGLRTAAVGGATARALVEAGAEPPPLVADEGGADALWPVLRDADRWPGRQVLVPTTPGGRRVLMDRLRDAGAVVDEVEAYRMCRRSPDALVGAWHEAAPNAAVIASPAAAETLVDAIGAPALRQLRAVVAIGRTTADALSHHEVPCLVAGRTDFAEAARRWQPHRAAEVRIDDGRARPHLRRVQRPWLPVGGHLHPGHRLLRAVAPATGRALPHVVVRLVGVRDPARVHVGLSRAARHGLAVPAPGGHRHQRAAPAGGGPADLPRLRPAACSPARHPAGGGVGLDHHLRHGQHARGRCHRHPAPVRRHHLDRHRLLARTGARVERCRSGAGRRVRALGPASPGLSTAARVRCGRALRRVRRRAVPLCHRPGAAVHGPWQRARPAGRRGPPNWSSSRA